MRRRPPRLLATAAMLAGVSAMLAGADAAEDRYSTAKIVPHATGEKISNIEWTESEPKVRIEAHGEESRFYVILEGKYVHEEWTLLANNQRVLPKKGTEGEFTLEAPISKKALAVEFVAVGPLGEIEKETVGILFSDWETKKEEAQVAPPKRLFVTPGLGFTQLTHKEAGLSDYKTIAVTAKVSTNYLLFPPRWDFGGSAFLTAFQITRTGSEDVRYLGVNARMGYIVPTIRDPWRLGLYGGLYYTTMFVSPSSFGFKNMAGPQLFPAVRRTLKNGHAVSGYLKYSPVSSNFSLLKLSNREFAIGGGYVYPMPGGHTIIGTLDVANIAMVLRGIAISSTSISLGAAYGF